MRYRFTVAVAASFALLELWVYLSGFVEPGRTSFAREWEWVVSLGLLLVLLVCLAYHHRQQERKWPGRVFFIILVGFLVLSITPLAPPASTPYNVKVFKSERRLVLYREGDEIGAWPIALNGAEGDKQVMGDGKTPEGRFIVVDKAPSQFHRWLGLNYPNLEDAWRGRRDGKITWLEFWRLRVENLNGRYPHGSSSLGGAIGIHGGGNRPDWTLGCIALSNSDVDFLYQMVPLGTVVEIFP